MTPKERSTIGLQKIWAEGQGVEKVSLFAVVGHVTRRAIENLRRARITSSLTVVTIAVALSVLSFFALIVGNCADSVQRESGDMMVMIFLRDSVTPIEVDDLKKGLSDLTKGLPVSYMESPRRWRRFERCSEMTPVCLRGSTRKIPSRHHSISRLLILGRRISSSPMYRSD